VSCITVAGLTVGSRSPGEVLSVVVSFVVSFIDFPPGAAVLSWLSTARFLVCLFCVSGDGVGFWGVSCVTAISRPDGSFVCGSLFA
jgi:hypothetical protein